jgi:nicotinic acid mononucleotide adenylyltransferase
MKHEWEHWRQHLETYTSALCEEQETLFHNRIQTVSEYIDKEISSLHSLLNEVSNTMETTRVQLESQSQVSTLQSQSHTISS